MDLLKSFGIALALAMDAFSVSVSSGAVMGQVKLKHSLRVGLFFGVAQAVMPLIGFFVGNRFGPYVESFAAWISFALFIIIGGKMIFDVIFADKEEAKDVLNMKTLFFLAIATSIDALLVGISVGFTTEIPYGLATIIGSVTFILCMLGIYLGKGIGKLLKNKAEVLGGAILIFIGVKTILDHLGITLFG